MQDKRVLIVDDDAAIRTMLSTVLRQQFLHVDMAEDGQSALDLVHANQYAVILLDLMMPRMGGLKVLNRLSEIGHAAGSVVLVITAADPWLVARLDSRRIHGVIRKPFDPHEVASVVRGCAEIRSGRSLDTMAVASMLAGPFLAIFGNRIP